MKKIFLLLISITLLLSFAGCTSAAKAPAKTILAIDRIDEPAVMEHFKDKRVGLFTNQSGVNSKLENSVDILIDKVNVTAIFAPEHGLVGAVPAGDKFNDTRYRDKPVYSLYGATRRPTPAMLANIDVMAVDIQDVGARHYTYFSSLAYIMEECAKQGKKVVVFDRPNPLGGNIEGPVLKPEHKSFIGLYEIPLRHGLTIGEFARYINTEEKINCQLEVVPLKNWKRSMLWRDTGLAWVQTSPLIPTAETTIYYVVTGVCPGVSLENGFGSAKPFHFVGTKYADPHKVKQALDALKLSGVVFRTATYNTSSGVIVKGVELFILEPAKVNLAELQYHIIYTLQELYPQVMKNYPQRYGNLGESILISLGEDTYMKHKPKAETFARWQNECAAFKKRSQKYWLYK